MAASTRTRCSSAWRRSTRRPTDPEIGDGGREPAPFDVRFTPAAERELRKLRADDAARLRRPILALRLEPRPTASQVLAGSRYRRLRAGDLRVVYLVDDDARLVLIVRVARRSESTYRRL